MRTLASSLLAYNNLLDSPSTVESLAIHSPLLDSPKFWKLGRHNSAGVRQAFYVVVSKLCQVLPDAVVTRGASAVPAILGGGLQDADVPAAAWGAALHLLAVFPGAWAHISPQKAVFPTIWKLLKAGGIGESQAAQIYPNLMPFLSKIPPEVMGDSGKFLQRWFSSMFEGLQVDKVQKNPTECRAVVQSMVECLFYCLNKQDLEVEVKDSLVNEYLLELVKFAVAEGREKNCQLFLVLPDYLLFWDRNCAGLPQLANLNTLFWSGLKYFCSTCDEGNRLELANAMIALARVLESKCIKEKEKSDPSRAGYVAEMMDILALIASRTVSNLEQPDSDIRVQESVAIMESILSNFGHHDIILARISGGEESGANARLNLYRGKIAPLLLTHQQACSEESLSRLAWALAKQAETSEAVTILEEFVSAMRPLVVNYIVPLALAEASGKGHQFLSTWLAGDFILSLLTDIAEGLALSMEETSKSSSNKTGGSGDNNNWTILRTILGCGVAIPEVTVKQLVAVFLQGVQSVTRAGSKVGSGSAAKIVEFVCELFSVLVSTGQADLNADTSGLELVRVIFSLDAASFGAATKKKLDSAWKMAIERSEKPKESSEMCHLLCKDLSATLAKDLVLSDLETVIDKARQLIQIVVKKDTEVSADIVELVSLMIPQVEDNLSEQHLYQSVFSQKLFLTHPPERLDTSLLLQSEVEPKHLTRSNIALFLVSVLAEMLALDLSSSSADDTVADEARTALPTALAGCERLMTGLANVAHAVVYLQSLLFNRSTGLELVNLERRLERSAAVFFARLSRPDLEQLQQRVYDRSRQEGLAWPSALAWLLSLVYKYSEWDLKLTSYLPLAPDSGDWSDGDLNTTVAVLQLMAQMNAGHSAISATLGLELGRLLSLGGLTDVETAFPRVWLITQCIQLTKVNCVGWHVSRSLECREEVAALLDLIPLWRADREEHLLYNTDLGLVSLINIVSFRLLVLEPFT